MRITPGALILSLFFLIFPVAQAALRSIADIVPPLRLGDESEAVLVLQKALNADKDTQVAASGPGSPGQETSYFGARTLEAVKRFQEKYKTEVLSPAGLSSPTGIVGPLTLKKLGALIALSHKQQSLASSSASSVSLSPQTLAALKDTDVSRLPFTPIDPGMVAQSGVNPNLLNLEYVLGVIREQSRKSGMSEQTIEQAIAAIRQVTATTTDLHKEFFSQFGSASVDDNLPSAIRRPIRTFFDTLLTWLGIKPQVAYALPAALPFGGYIVASFPCICSTNVWYVTTGPSLPPTYAVTYNAIPGTQLFLYRNVPLPTTAILGEYNPLAGQACYVPTPGGCVQIPAQGLILPFVGSSLAP